MFVGKGKKFCWLWWFCSISFQRLARGDAKYLDFHVASLCCASDPSPSEPFWAIQAKWKWLGEVIVRKFAPHKKAKIVPHKKIWFIGCFVLWLIQCPFCHLHMSPNCVSIAFSSGNVLYVRCPDRIQSRCLADVWPQKSRSARESREQADLPIFLPQVISLILRYTFKEKEDGGT